MSRHVFQSSLLSLSIAICMSLTSMNTQAADPEYALTIYSSAQPGQLTPETLQNYGAALPGYGLVRDRRELELPKGSGEVRFTDVATRIDPTTVSFASLTDPDGTRVVEQNYQFDLVDGQKLLQRYLGETVTVDQVQGDKFERITGTLLSATNGLILQKAGGEVVTLNHYTNIQFPSLPGGLITRPTLVWLVDARRGGKHDAVVSYQTQGLTWWSDYNVTLRGGSEDCSMDLAAWVTIVNQSGGSFPETRLKLVAGEVNRAPAASMAAPAPMMVKAMRSEMAVADGFQESSLFEYHLYTLGRRTDLPNNSTKQLELFPAAVGTKCKRELVFTAGPGPWRWYGAPITDQGFGATQPGTVGAYLEFKNDQANGLGIPLPAGRVRVNQAGADGSLEFIGEDLIKHTPRNETLRIKLGESFDVVGERKQTDFKVDTNGKWLEETFEVSVRNRKKEAANVVAREYLYRWSGWTIKSASRSYQKRDAETIDFPLTIAADGEAKFSYTVRYTW